MKGWVLGPTDEIPAHILPVRKAISPVRFFDDEILALLRWVSERYVAPLASVIARSHPPRVVSEETGSGSRERGPLSGGTHPPLRSDGSLLRGAGTPEDALASYRHGSALLESLRGGAGTFVLRPAPEDEVGVAVDAVRTTLSGGRGAIVLVPEAEPLPATAAGLVEVFGERVALYLGGSKRGRYRMWLDVLAGRYDVLVGTRPGVFAPVLDLGLVYVSRESHSAHREERSPYYHVRDVALARARIASAVCVMSAAFPSTEAAAVDATEVASSGRRWPPVEVVKPGPEGRAPRLIAALRESERGFLYSPLPGYGVAQVCRSCGRPAACAACGGVLRLETGTVRCVVCGAAGSCAECGSTDFGLRRGGAERVEEWAARVAPVPVRRWTDADATAPPSKGILVGGPEAVKDTGRVGLDVVGILDADLALRRPGMSAIERSLATWAEAAGWARPRGRVVVQSTRPNDPAVQSLVAGRPDRFHRAETARRAEAGFPVGAPVFRVAGSAELPAELERLSPITLLSSGAGSQTVCLLALEPGRVEEFGRLARQLAAREVLTRVEAEPHL